LKLNVGLAKYGGDEVFGNIEIKMGKWSLSYHIAYCFKVRVQLVLCEKWRDGCATKCVCIVAAEYREVYGYGDGYVGFL